MRPAASGIGGLLYSNSFGLSGARFRRQIVTFHILDEANPRDRFLSTNRGYYR